MRPLEKLFDWKQVPSPNKILTTSLPYFPMYKRPFI